MNFSGNDKYILVGSFMVVLFMSLIFPALGMTSDSANETDVPELDINQNNVDVVGDRPSYPRSPTQGSFTYNTKRTYPMETKIGENSDGLKRGLATYCFNDNPVNEECRVQLSVFTNTSNANIEHYNLNQSDFTERNTTILTAENGDGDEWRVLYEFVEMENWGTMGLEYTVNWEILEKPEESSTGLADIPIVGGIFSAGEGLVNMLAWIGEMIFWFFGWIIELVVNAIAILVNSILFALDLVTYMTSNYSSIISETSGIAAFMLTIPVILLSVELLKLGLIFISVLPTT